MIGVCVLSDQTEQWIQEPFMLGLMDDTVREAIERKGWTIERGPRRNEATTLARGRLGVYEVSVTHLGPRAVLVGP